VAGLGSDTCGSIRIPAAHNSLVGLRGTQGTSSRTGIVPLSTTQDIGGPLARSIVDLSAMLDATVGPDPADPSTIVHGRRLASFRRAVGAATLEGARLGVVRSLFGGAPEDAEVTAVVDRALEALAAAGATIEDVSIPGLEDLLRGSSMINADFKADLAAYLASVDNPPVRSLSEILDAGLLHAALESGMRARNAVASRETDATRRARVKRVALATAVEATLDEHQLVALVYPTLRRKAARIGDAQAGSNCQLSAHSGLPALALPAGFTDDGLPVGIDLLGRAFGDVELVGIGGAIEALLDLRQRPFSTPTLVDGRRPAPARTSAVFERRGGRAVRTDGLTIDLAYDQAASQLAYVLGPSLSVSDVRAVWIHQGAASTPGAARHRLFAPGLPMRGVVTLTASDRRAVEQSQLFLRLYFARSPEWLDASFAFGTDAPLPH
jgi:Asp-tRNA(Asn)/Glu-tRNA(Gln) amidotransferase A subunit family amidase